MGVQGSLGCVAAEDSVARGSGDKAASFPSYLLSWCGGGCMDAYFSHWGVSRAATFVFGAHVGGSTRKG